MAITTADQMFQGSARPGDEPVLSPEEVELWLQHTERADLLTTDPESPGIWVAPVKDPIARAAAFIANNQAEITLGEAYDQTSWSEDHTRRISPACIDFASSAIRREIEEIIPKHL